MVRRVSTRTVNCWRRATSSPAQLRRVGDHTRSIVDSRWPRRLSSVASTSVTAVVYVGLFSVANAVLLSRSASVQQEWLDWASTDLVNLGRHAFGSMITSAFVDDADIAAWIALGLIALVSAGHTLGNRRTALLVTVSHVGGTLVSEGILALRIRAGTAPSAERVSLDVGPSYVVVAALWVGIVWGRWPARVACVIAFVALAPHLFGGLSHFEVGPVGHCCAVVVGVVGGYLLRSRPHPRRQR